MHFDFNLDFIVKNDHYESLFLQRFILFIQIISMLSISYTGLKSITYYFESQLEVQLNILQFVFIMISSFIQLIFILEIIDSFSFFSKPFTLIFILQIGLFFPPLILMSIYLRTQILQYQTRVQQILAGVTLLSVLLSPVYPFLVIFMVSSDETIFLIHQIIMCYPIISYLLISDKIKIKLLRTRFFAFYLSDYALKQVFAFFIFCQSSKISRYDRQNENILEIVSLINLIAILTPKIRFKTKFRLSNKINLNLQRQGDCIQCPICLEIIDYNDKNSFLQAPCAHIFHQNCILSWVEYNASCPVCREKLAK
ncbi:Ring finger domain-containing protein [Spironucleus salmonicida]|uniref:Ring finger domain-containing protein n=1 Tax=Spironucleus salmonicida TaxID=348837 RepID=A0A9P8LWE9_9EUKA|nr:Ring finger domain-containing protein [Spironucleus salmonicida]